MTECVSSHPERTPYTYFIFATLKVNERFLIMGRKQTHRHRQRHSERQRQRPRETVAEPTCAGDDDVHLSDDFIQFHQPEAVHAVLVRKTIKSVRRMQRQHRQWAAKELNTSSLTRPARHRSGRSLWRRRWSPLLWGRHSSLFPPGRNRHGTLSYSTTVGFNHLSIIFRYWDFPKLEWVLIAASLLSSQRHAQSSLSTCSI